MKRYLAILFCSVLLAGLAAMNVNAQGPADTHVNAAKAASTKAGNTTVLARFQLPF